MYRLATVGDRFTCVYIWTLEGEEPFPQYGVRGSNARICKSLSDDVSEEPAILKMEAREVGSKD